MPLRVPFIGGNWKMNTDRAGAIGLARAVCEALRNDAGTAAGGAEVALFPPFPYLLAVRDVLSAFTDRGGPRPLLGAQDVYPEKNGAFTGEVSPEMLVDVGVEVVLTGHSERRHVIGETDDLINRKTRAVLDAGLRCILCVGETLAQREAGETDTINERQVRAGLAGVPSAHAGRVTIAYEPVWAIGTGRTATPADAQQAHARIRAVLADLYGDDTARGIRIQYGGSVKGSNAADLTRQPDIDGALVGGASLNAAEFAAIVGAAARNPG